MNKSASEVAKETLSKILMFQQIHDGESMIEATESALKQFARQEIQKYVDDVNRLAENNMLKTGKLEGSHHAAMKVILETRMKELE